MQNASKWLSALLGITLVAGIFVLPQVEQAYAPEAANIRNIGDAVWYAIVTLTTVGYGDFYPVSMPGQIIGVVFVLSSLGVLGVLIGKVADLFTEYREKRRLGHYGTEFENHVIIIGWDQFSRRVVNRLVSAEVKVAVVTNVRKEVDEIYEDFDEEEVFVLFTDYEQYDRLSRANVSKATEVFLNRTSDTDTLVTLLNLTNEFGDLDLHYVARIKNDELRPAFNIDGVRAEPVTTFEVASALIASHIFEPDVAAFGQDLIASATHADDYEIQQYRVTEESDWTESEYGELFWTLYEKHQILSLGLSKRNGGARELVELPGDNVSIAQGDYVIVIVNGRTVKAAAQEFGATEGLQRSIDANEES